MSQHIAPSVTSEEAIKEGRVPEHWLKAIPPSWELEVGMRVEGNFCQCGWVFLITEEQRGLMVKEVLRKNKYPGSFASIYKKLFPAMGKRTWKQDGNRGGILGEESALQV